MIKIRTAKERDDKVIKELIVGILEEEFPQEEKALFGSDIENVSKTYAGDGSSFLVACDGEQIVGTVGIKREDERNALLRRIFVKHDYRRRSIAKQLIQHAIDFCRQEGYEEIVFKTTSRMENAIRLCQANGFAKKATIHLGGLDLFKFTLHLQENKNSHVLIPQKEKRRKS